MGASRSEIAGVEGCTAGGAAGRGERAKEGTCRYIAGRWGDCLEKDFTVLSYFRIAYPLPFLSTGWSFHYTT